MENVLACNAGSSSLKLSLFAGSAAQGWALRDTVNLAADGRSFSDMLFGWLDTQPQPDCILHRVVHAGAVPERACVLDAPALARIRHWLPMAPRHNALTLELIEALQQRWPEMAQFAIHDSGIYAGLPERAARYAIADQLSPSWPLRRYGFHGLAHRSQWRQLCRVQEDAGRSSARVISIHLGSGASVTAWQQGRAIDTSMGFSPLEGLIMARRSGSIDPGILIHLLLREGLDAQTLEQILHQHSGLEALAGHDGDLRLIMDAAREQGPESAAALAVDQYCYQVKKAIGAYMTALGGVDAISMGGGVAEHQPAVRAGIFSGLEGLGIVLGDPHATALHAPESSVALYLTPVNEMDEMLRQYEVFLDSEQ